MMSHAVVCSPPELAMQRVIVRLNNVRRGILARAAAAGLAKTLWLIIGSVAADLLIDRLFRLDVSQRALMLVMISGMVGWSARRWLYQPLAARVSDDSVALAIEAANPRLGQSLITALQLSRDLRPKSGSGSTAFRRRAIELGAKLADEVSFRSVLDSRRFRRNLVLVAAAALVILSVIVALPFLPLLRTGLSRNLLLSRATWPQQTYLTVDRLNDNGAVVCPRGGDWIQGVEVTEHSAVVPDAVYLEVRQTTRGAGRESRVMQRINERRFESTFQNIVQPFEFRARGGDAVTDWVRVELVDPPALRELAITVTPPKYCGQPVEALAPGQSAYQVLPGSRLEIDCTANKPLSAAELIHGDQRWPLKQSDIGNQNRFHGTVDPGDLSDGLYSVKLVDSLGLSSRAAEFRLRWLADRLPRVVARLESSSNLVLAAARLPIFVQAADDYGLHSLAAVISYGTGDVIDWAEKRLPLLPSDDLARLGEATDRRQAEVSRAIDLEPLQLAVGANVRVQVEAADNNDIGGPGIGHSAEFFLRVVEEAEFRSDLLRREKAERQELERLLKSQDDLLTDCRALAAAGRASVSTSNGQIEQLQAIYRGQKQLGQRLVVVADRIAALAADIQHNRLPDPGATLQNRLQSRIAEPLRVLAAKVVPSIVETLDAVRQATQAGSKIDLALAIAGQDEVRSGLKRILEQMLSSEGYQEAIDLLYEIQKAQSEVFDQTTKAREEQVQRILEGRK